MLLLKMLKLIDFLSLQEQSAQPLLFLSNQLPVLTMLLLLLQVLLLLLLLLLLLHSSLLDACVRLLRP